MVTISKRTAIILVVVIIFISIFIILMQVGNTTTTPVPTQPAIKIYDIKDSLVGEITGKDYIVEEINNTYYSRYVHLLYEYTTNTRRLNNNLNIINTLIERGYKPTQEDYNNISSYLDIVIESGNELQSFIVDNTKIDRRESINLSSSISSQREVFKNMVEKIKEKVE